MSAMIGIYNDEQLDSAEGAIELLDYAETKSRDLFGTMEAFSDDDKDKIKARILAVCTPDEFNSRIRNVAMNFDNSTRPWVNVISAPFFLIFALICIALFLIILVPWIILMAVKVVVICCLCLGRAVCPPQPAGPSYKRLL